VVRIRLPPAASQLRTQFGTVSIHEVLMTAFDARERLMIGCGACKLICSAGRVRWIGQPEGRHDLAHLADCVLSCMTSSRPGKTLDRPIATKSSAFPVLLGLTSSRDVLLLFAGE
jgi:hypothetical protein